MATKSCADCGKPFEVEGNEVAWKNYCYECYKIRKTLSDQGLSKEEVEKIRHQSKKKEVNLVQNEVEVIQPAQDLDKAEDRLEAMKREYEGFVGEIPQKGMKFKEISVSLGEKVSVDYQSKNAQVGAVIIVGNISPELAYQSALNFVKDRLKEEVKRIREEML